MTKKFFRNERVESMNSLTDRYELYNHVEVPCVGFGTWQAENGRVATAAIRCALETGYRHIDTASAYYNEESVGRAFRESGLARSEVFITSKLWNTDHGYDKTLCAFEKTLGFLKTDYLDLYLIHWPIPFEHQQDWQETLPETWRAIEKIYADKRVRAIGVSNFRPRHLEHILKHGRVKPMVNQIEYHPGFTQPETVEYCHRNRILIQAWSPLAQGRVFDLPLLNDLAKKYDKSLAQVCLRWELQNGINPLPKSVTPERIRQNADIFDFELTDDEMNAIDDLPEYGATGYDPDNFIYPS